MFFHNTQEPFCDVLFESENLLQDSTLGLEFADTTPFGCSASILDNEKSCFLAGKEATLFTQDFTPKDQHMGDEQSDAKRLDEMNVLYKTDELLLTLQKDIGM